MTGGAEPGPSPAAILDARGRAYDLLANAFLQEPSRAFLAALIESGAVHAWPFADAGEPTSRALEQVRRHLERPDALSEVACGALGWDFTRLFIGPGRVPAPPWESVYRDREQLHFSEDTLHVRSTYQRYGLQAGSFGREPDDHVGLELDFLRQLSERAAAEARAGNWAAVAGILADQRAFLDEHLLVWAPAFAADVAGCAASDFYRGLAELLAAHLPFDRRLIDLLLDDAACPAPPSGSPS